MAKTQARVARLKICTDDDCALQEPNVPHLSIVLRLVQLSHESSVKAISYAWGEFGREDYCVGHFEDGTPAFMELGREWHLPDLVHTLEKICSASNGGTDEPLYCWMDQICIYQDDPEEVRQTLSGIPDIYKTFETVVLVPGPQCSCFIEDGRRVDEAEKYAEGSEFFYEICFNTLSIYTWTQRLWTRQELLYSRTVQTIWTNDKILQCPKKDRDFQYSKGDPALGPTAHLWASYAASDILRNNKDYFNRVVNKYLRNLGVQAFTNLIESMSEWYTLRRGQMKVVEYQAIMLAVKFLSGKKIEVVDWKTISEKAPDQEVAKLFDNMHLEDKQEVALHQFLLQLSQLSMAERKATRPRDYILSVWVDCPLYVIPDAFKEMTPGALLEDAVIQLERNFPLILSTNTPASFFDPEALPLAWRPRQLIDSAPLTGLSDVYGPIPTAPSLFFCDLSHFCSKQSMRVLMTDDKLFNDFSWFAPDDTLEFLEQAVLAWSYDRAKRMAAPGRAHFATSVLTGQGGFEDGDQAKKSALTYFGWLVKEREKRSGPAAPYSAPVLGPVTQTVGDVEGGDGAILFAGVAASRVIVEEAMAYIDWNDVAFELVCAALGVHPVAARKQGVKLMIRTTEPAMLGLTKVTFGEQENKRERIFSELVPLDAEEDQSTLAYECYVPGLEMLKLDPSVFLSNRESSRMWVPMGVWVPLRLSENAKREEMQTMRPADADARIQGGEEFAAMKEGFLEAHPEWGI